MESFQDFIFYCTQGTKLAKWSGWALLVYGLWSYFLKPLVKFITIKIQTYHKAANIIPLLETITKEFRPNGGSSMRDAIDQIQQAQTINTLRHRAIIAHLHIATFETDAAGMYIFVSRAWCEITRMMPEQAYGEGWISSVHILDRERVVAEWRHAVEDKREFYSEYRVILYGRDESVAVTTRAFPARIKADGPLTGMVGITTKSS